jgi:site-specific recombinase XerD
MSISPAQLAPLRSFGYTEVESSFLYLVATHSGYFTVRQFLDFAHAKSGKRNAHLIEKLFSQADWVFASPDMAGKQPYWPENLLRRHIQPAARRCGINKRIGWHTFRHSYATHLKANGEDIKVVQESLRHANSRITLDTYTQALTPAKREAQSKVVRMILPEQTQTAVAGGGK